jgi:acyl carrier protein
MIRNKKLSRSDKIWYTLVMPDTLAEKVIAVLAEVRNRPIDSITLDSTLEDLGFDSLDVITASFELEEMFDISLSDEKVRSMRNVRDVVEGIRGLTIGKVTDA